MEIEEIISSIKNFDFDDIIRREARAYLTDGYSNMPYLDREDDKKFITNGQKRFINKTDKIIFLLEAINYLNAELIEINKRIDYELPDETEQSEFFFDKYDRRQSNEESKNAKKRREAQIFYAVRELEKLGLKNLDKNAFSTSHVDDLTRKINALLIKIDELTVGQEVIYNFVDELKIDLNEIKSEFPLGKKRWYQRFSGIVAGYLGNKGADALYDLIKPDIMKIVHEQAIGKLLH